MTLPSGAGGGGGGGGGCDLRVGGGRHGSAVCGMTAKGGRALLTVGLDDMAGGFFRTSTRPTLSRRSSP